MVQYFYCFFKIATLYFSFRSVSILKNYRLINPYGPVWSNLAIGIGKIHIGRPLMDRAVKSINRD